MKLKEIFKKVSLIDFYPSFLIVLFLYFNLADLCNDMTSYIMPVIYKGLMILVGVVVFFRDKCEEIEDDKRYKFANIFLIIILVLFIGITFYYMF